MNSIAAGGGRTLHPVMHSLMWNANLTRAAHTETTSFVGGPQKSNRRRRGPAVDYDEVWRCEKRRCAAFNVPYEDWLVGVIWVTSDAPDTYRQTRSHGEREYGSVSTTKCQMRGYVPVPLDLRVTCLHDGKYRLDSIGIDPRTLMELPYLTAFKAYDLLVTLHNSERESGKNLSGIPTDMALWHRNYTINDTFLAQDIGTFKEVHCEIKKCDVNTF
jgi:hypothetical protein